MSFQKGNKFAKGGKRPGAGAKKQSEIAAKETAAVVFRNVIEANAKPLAKRYVERALGEHGDRVLCHIVDKALPDEQVKQQPTYQISFIQFNHSVQLPAEALPSGVLAGHGDEKKSGARLASPGGQGQDSIEFYDFADVSGERG